VSAIERIEVSVFTVPTDQPESDGTIEWDSTTLVLAQACCEGVTGLGYSYADPSGAKLIEDKLRDPLLGRDPMDIPGAWLEMIRQVRNLGRPGLASHAISAVDNALWDLKARLLEMPLAKLLGCCRDQIEVYGSGGFTSYDDRTLSRQLGGWARQGFRSVKMKVGRDPTRDPERVSIARKAIGSEVRLFVDANGAYSRKQALRLAEEFSALGVSWFEEPVSSDDLEGLNLIRDRAPAGMDIAAGEYGYDATYFERMLRSGAVDVLQADATRCLGISGFLHAAALCQARNIPLSAHTAPALHVHLCCAAPQARNLEYFHDHARIESLLFENAPEPSDGYLAPDLTKPGNGLELRRKEASRYEAA
jgi:L-alanine-DL-glutamate epimerase-like enolase superfamily enzyme